MKTMKKTGLLFIPKKLNWIRKKKEEVGALDLNLNGIGEYLYFRSYRH